MICHCDACNYTFEDSVLHSKCDVPTRCPDCGKKTVGGAAAVRAATEKEVEEYREEQRIVMEELYEELNSRDMSASA